ncbi:limonene 1,2-monooxygenase [Nocardioides daedukensis]|uniref:Limonene 1,2-monooxygenase n=1 Tax=Nocardioides daedukensis TaxID=634462 RepID=A0A7Y9RYP0_9ACTN|nr:LLM class flavin-dependent oxidoreductase [Nocardioides daedukensis]NYG57182.1 limonene 1,2-monooxygenase [Nocardioides daedukensis]
MKFGIFTMPEHPPRENWTLSYDRDIADIVLAESLGFDEYWIGEHHTGGYENVPMPELMIAKASAVTSRIRLGTGVVNLPYQDPFLVAERMAFLDHLTHGRLIYGFGGGGLPTDKALFQMAPEEATPRTNESLEIIWRLLTETEPVTHEGVFWHYEERQLQVGPYQVVPPMAVAGLTGTHNFERCGNRGWIPLSVYFAPLLAEKNPMPDLADHKNAILKGAADASLDADQAMANWRISREVYVASDKNTAMNEIRAGVKMSYDYLLGLGLGALMKLDAEMADPELTFEWMVENVPWIIGSPEDCVEQIHHIREDVGDFGTFLINGRDWVTTDRWNRSLELFARYVMPQFQDHQHMPRRERLARKALGLD